MSKHTPLSLLYRMVPLTLACVVLLTLGSSGSASAASGVTGSEALGITRSAVTVTGSVNPEGSDTHYYFQYGQGTAYGQDAPSVEGEDVGEGSSAVSVSVRLTGLVPATVYHYRLVATDGQGVILAMGADEAFTTSPATPPTVSTGSASSVTLTAATLTGVIDPNGLETSYVLELGTETTYGTSISGEVGASSEPVSVSVPVVQLAPGTTYHYRFVGVNGDGRTYGQDQMFTTPVYDHPIVLPGTEPLVPAPTIAFPAIDEQASGPSRHNAPTHKKKHPTKKRHGKKKRRPGARGLGSKAKPGKKK